MACAFSEKFIVTNQAVSTAVPGGTDITFSPDPQSATSPLTQTAGYSPIVRTFTNASAVAMWPVGKIAYLTISDAPPAAPA